MKAPLRTNLETPRLSEAKMKAILQRARDRARRPRRRAVAVAFAAAAAAAAVAGWLWTRSAPAAPGPLLTEAGSVFSGLAVASGASPRTVRFREGSSIHAAAGAEIVGLESSGLNQAVLVRRGRVDFDVVPGGPRRWTVEAGLARIEVVGTRFSVERGRGSVHVDVERGAVLVRSAHLADGVARLEAGEQLEVGPEAKPGAPTSDPSAAAPEPKPKFEPTSKPESKSEPEPEPGPEPEAGVPPTGSGPARSPQRTRRRAEANLDAPTPAPERRSASGRPAQRQARGPAPKRSAPPRATSSPPPTQPPPSFEVVDEARVEGRFELAASYLAAIVGDDRRPTEERALAAFLLGRTRLEDLEAPGEATLAFERALALGLPASLERSARARLTLALKEAGRPSEARRAARDFLRRYSKRADDHALIRAIAEP